MGGTNTEPGEGGRNACHRTLALTGSSSDSFCSLRAQTGYQFLRRSPGHHTLTTPFPAILPSTILFCLHPIATRKLPEVSLPSPLLPQPTAQLCGVFAQTAVGAVTGTQKLDIW